MDDSFWDDIKRRQARLEELERELAQVRADAALVVRALDAALVLVNGLLIWLPEGQVLPSELGGMKQQLDDALEKIGVRKQ